MSTEAELDAMFEAGASDDQAPPAKAAPEPVAAEPAKADAAPAAVEAAAQPAEQQTPEDELAGLPPKVRAMLEEFQQIKQAAAAVQGLEQRLRKTEGRLGDLNTRLPAPTPPAPPKLEKFERLRQELPEVAEGIEEILAARQTKQEPDTDTKAPTAPVLEAERPGWQEEVIGSEFQQWLARQDASYRSKVESTTSEAVLLGALTRFDAHKELQAERARLEAERQAQVQKLAQTRTTRAAAAVAPAGAGRRAPQPAETLDDIFERAGAR